MAKKNSTKDKKKEKNEKYYSDYPIKSLFQVAMLAASISFILFYLRNTAIIDALFKSFLVFIAVSVAGAVIIIVVFSILGSIKQQEYEQMIAQKNAEKSEDTAPNPNMLPGSMQDPIKL